MTDKRQQARDRLATFHQAQLQLAVPEYLAIVCLGSSKAAWFQHQLQKHGDRPFDQVWTVNRGGSVIDHDLLWVMDDLVGEERLDAPYGAWLHGYTTTRPLVTSTAYPGRFPMAHALPLVDLLLAHPGRPYFQNSVPYLVAYAVALGVPTVALFGADYTLADGRILEHGLANVEYWLGAARAEGINVGIPDGASLMGGKLNEHHPLGWWYGYPGNVAPQAVQNHLRDLATAPVERDEIPTTPLSAATPPSFRDLEAADSLLDQARALVPDLDPDGEGYVDDELPAPVARELDAAEAVKRAQDERLVGWDVAEPSGRQCARFMATDPHGALVEWRAHSYTPDLADDQTIRLIVAEAGAPRGTLYNVTGLPGGQLHADRIGPWANPFAAPPDDQADRPLDQGAGR